MFGKTDGPVGGSVACAKPGVWVSVMDGRREQLHQRIYGFSPPASEQQKGQILQFALAEPDPQNKTNKKIGLAMSTAATLTRGTTNVTAAELESFRAAVTNEQYANTVLQLARAGRLRPKVLADAAYTSWLKSENPKRVLSVSEWTELFRLSYLAGHVLFEVQD